MNIVSVLVSASLMGLIAPGIAQMAIQPAIAQKRAHNFAQAEVAAVTFAGQAEAAQSLPDIPDRCSVEPPENSVYSITCTRGESKFAASVTRAFRIIDEIDDGGSGGRTFQYETPDIGANACLPDSDPWGVNWWNDLHGRHVGACVPTPAANQDDYLASNPDDWLYDINNINGWGHHPDY